MTQDVGIILNGVTGRMGTNQHLERSLCSIIKDGGIHTNSGHPIMPRVTLTGRNEEKLRALAEKHGQPTIGEPFPYTTDLEGALNGKYGEHEIFFDASSTLHRGTFIEMAVAAGKAIYCEKPTAVDSSEAIRLAQLVDKAGLKNGVVQDKLWLPGFLKVRSLIEEGFFGKILSVRGEFGYWVFTGLEGEPQAQRPSWNYRSEDGGGIMIDMFCHWHYLINSLFGPVRRLVAYGNTDIDKRSNETGEAFSCTADDSAYAIFVLADGTVCQFNSSWCVRVRRDDLLCLEINGTRGSAVAGLRDVYLQTGAETPKPVWNPDVDQPIDFLDGWKKMPDETEYENAFKIQWQDFLRHVVLDEPWKYSLQQGAKGVQLAELGMQSWKESRWMEIPEL